MKIAATERGLRQQLNALYMSENEIHWTRAALVFAFIESGTVRSNLDFANMKLQGLKSSGTVSLYRQAWAKAIELGFAKHIEPGSQVDLPTLDFEKVSSETARGQRVAERRGNKQPSIQNERHSDATASTPKPPRTVSAKENVEHAIREVEVAIKKEFDGIRRKQLELALFGLQNALQAYKRRVTS